MMMYISKIAVNHARHFEKHPARHVHLWGTSTLRIQVYQGVIKTQNSQISSRTLNHSPSNKLRN